MLDVWFGFFRYYFPFLSVFCVFCWSSFGEVICKKLPFSSSFITVFRSGLQNSLKRSFGRPRLRLPTTNTPYNKYFWVRSSPNLRKWPSKQSLPLLRVKYIVVQLVGLNTSYFIIYCCHNILWIRRKLTAHKTTLMFHYRMHSSSFIGKINVRLFANK